MSGTLIFHSFKNPLPPGQRYLIGAQGFQQAIEPQLDRDGHLSLYFEPTQAYWKEDRERIAQSGRFLVFELGYSATKGPFWPPVISSIEPWGDEPDPIVLSAKVRGVPVAATPKGVQVKLLVDQKLGHLEAELHRFNGVEYALSETIVVPVPSQETPQAQRLTPSSSPPPRASPTAPTPSPRRPPLARS